MKSFVTACLAAASAQALLTSSVTTKTAGASAPFNSAGGTKATTLEWGYDADELFVNITTGAIVTTAVSANDDKISAHVYFSYDPDESKN